PILAGRGRPQIPEVRAARQVDDGGGGEEREQDAEGELDARVCGGRGVVGAAGAPDQGRRGEGDREPGQGAPRGEQRPDLPGEDATAHGAPGGEGRWAWRCSCVSSWSSHPSASTAAWIASASSSASEPRTQRSRGSCSS